VPGEGDASGSRSSWHPGSNGMGARTFSDIHNSDHSRNHFGNVYNSGNVYNDVRPNDEHPESVEEKARDLIDALAFEGMSYRLMTTSTACADTCTWFLRTHEYTSWQDPARRGSHHGTLWIKGKAGTGKSTLMRYVHDHTQKHRRNGKIIAFFFHGRSSESLLKSTEGMYRSLLYQLYDQIPLLKVAVGRRLLHKPQRTWSIGILEDL
jgi:hypothetical protein